MRLGLPMTYGICRTNLRRVTRIGDELAFVMYVKEERCYYLSAWFVVAETLGHDEAARRFPGRTNMLLEPLFNGASETIETGGIRWAHARWDEHTDWNYRA